MRNLLVLALCTLTLSSCLLDDEKTDFGKGSNFVGFADNTITLQAVASGEVQETVIPIQIVGPSVNKLTEAITVNVNVDPSSTAIEGQNFQLNSSSITLTPNGDDLFEGELPITIVTEGVVTPVVGDAPVLVLNITEISTFENVLINDKTEQVSATIAYTCPFDILNYEGTYLATTDEFGIYIAQPEPFEVVAGPGENQITLVNVAAHPEAYDVVVDVNPANGNLTIERQVVLNFNNIGSPAYGELSWEGTGTSTPTSGACIGHLEMTNGYFVAAGTFGQYKTVFIKQ